MSTFCGVFDGEECPHVAFQAWCSAFLLNRMGASRILFEVFLLFSRFEHAATRVWIS